jgi:AhpC/TSA family
VLGITVDPPGATAAITALRRITFPLLSDPDGGGAIKPFGVWSESEGHARPATIVLAPGGEEVFRHAGADALDRPDPARALDAVMALGLAPRPPAAVYDYVEPEPSARAFPYELFAYFRGVRSAAMTLHGRTADEDSAAVLAMAERMLADLDDPAALP